MPENSNIHDRLNIARKVKRVISNQVGTFGEIWDYNNWSERDWLLNVICNDISVVNVTEQRCSGGLKKKFDLRSGSQRHTRHFVWFFNVPVQAPTRGQPFYKIIPRNRPIYSPFMTRLGYGLHILDLNPGSQRGKIWIYMAFWLHGCWG